MAKTEFKTTMKWHIFRKAVRTEPQTDSLATPAQTQKLRPKLTVKQAIRRILEEDDELLRKLAE